jgi:hypothetical protein
MKGTILRSIFVSKQAVPPLDTASAIIGGSIKLLYFSQHLLNKSFKWIVFPNYTLTFIVLNVHMLVSKM